jgi:hypothetical protein
LNIKEIINPGLLSALLLLSAQSLAWFQQFGHLRYPWMKNNIWLSVLLIGSVVSFAFIYAARFGYDYFGNAWAYRLIQFSIGVFVFTALSHFILNETMTTKNLVSIILSVAIVLIQIFWK